ncbi:Oligoendopeptidase F, partial [uncultured Leptolyngbya sp.]
RSWWSYVPHFIATPGYVYAYAYGQLLIVVLFLPDGLMGLLPKQFKLAEQSSLLPAPSSTTSGFVQARLFDWFTPLQRLVQHSGRSLIVWSRTVSGSARSSKGRSKLK